MAISALKYQLDAKSRYNWVGSLKLKKKGAGERKSVAYVYTYKEGKNTSNG